MSKQHTNPRVIVAAATGYSNAPWGVTFYGPMGHITLYEDGTHTVGGWARFLDTGGHKNPQVLEEFQQAYRAHPALTGKPLPAPTVEVSHIKIDCPEGEDWGTRESHKVTDWLGNEILFNKGYWAGPEWVPGWVG